MKCMKSFKINLEPLVADVVARYRISFKKYSYLFYYLHAKTDLENT